MTTAGLSTYEERLDRDLKWALSEGGVGSAKQHSVLRRPAVEEQVVGRGAIPGGGLDGGSQDVLVVVEPSGTEFGHGHRVEAEGSRGTCGELAVNLCGEPSGGVPVRADPRPPPPPVLVVTEIPDVIACVSSHLADTKRIDLRYDILGEPARHKVPQTLPQIEGSEARSEGQRPA